MTEEDEEKKEEAEGKTAEAAKTETATPTEENSGNGTPTKKGISKLDTMKQGNEAMKKTLDEREALLKRHMEMEERERVSGQASAGIELEKKEEDPADYAKRIQSGKI